MIFPGIITYINVTSVKWFVKIQNVFGSFKIIACLVVIGGGIYELVTGKLPFSDTIPLIMYIIVHIKWNNDF